MTHIILGAGFEGLQFGASQEEVLQTIGKPDEVERMDWTSDDQPSYTEYWYYSKLGFRAGFDAEDDLRLGTIATRSPAFTFEGVTLVGLDMNTAVDELENRDLGQPEIEDAPEMEEFNPEESLVQVSFETYALDLWCVDGKVDMVEWGYFWTAEEEPIWPQGN